MRLFWMTSKTTSIVSCTSCMINHTLSLLTIFVLLFFIPFYPILVGSRFPPWLQETLQAPWEVSRRAHDGIDRNSDTSSQDWHPASASHEKSSGVYKKLWSNQPQILRWEEAAQEVVVSHRGHYQTSLQRPVWYHILSVAEGVWDGSSGSVQTGYHCMSVPCRAEWFRKDFSAAELDYWRIQGELQFPENCFTITN